MKQRLLFVDDEPAVLAAYRRDLRVAAPQWEIACESCPAAAWEVLCNGSFDAAVLDFRMAGLNGFELLRLMRQNEPTRDVPVVIVTGQLERSLKRQALDLGAIDLLDKPVDRDDLIARLRSALALKKSRDRLARRNQRLHARVLREESRLAASRMATIWRLAKAAELRDEETGNHVIRVGCYSRAIANSIGLDERFADMLFIASPLHDIGKIGLPDSILLKPGGLTDEERSQMQRHCEFGLAILSSQSKFGDITRSQLQSRFATCLSDEEGAENSISAIRLAAEIAYAHHERWDGSGYPRGLAGAEIPQAARIVAIADVYDALRSQRTYKPAFSREDAVRIMRREVNRHFDAELLTAFLDAATAIEAIEAEWNDRADGQDAGGGS
jgi:putative two-component system response regulator